MEGNFDSDCDWGKDNNVERAPPTKIDDNALRNANNPLSVGNFARHCHSEGTCLARGTRAEERDSWIY